MSAMGVGAPGVGLSRRLRVPSVVPLGGPPRPSGPRGPRGSMGPDPRSQGAGGPDPGGLGGPGGPGGRGGPGVLKTFLRLEKSLQKKKQIQKRSEDVFKVLKQF